MLGSNKTKICFLHILAINIISIIVIFLFSRTVVQQDFSQVVEGCSHLSSPSPTELETPIYTFTLPDLTSFTGRTSVETTLAGID
jgi:hypothetical protein